MTNVLFVNPEYKESFWTFTHALRFVGKKCASPPLGLLTVAAMLPRDWSARLVDMNVEPLRDRDLQEADLVMIGGMDVQRDSAMIVLERCRRQGCRTVAGGPLFTSAADGEFADLVDHLVLGEAEVTFPRFLSDFRRDAARSVYRCTAFPDLSTTPVPRWDLIDIKRYQTLMIQSSRGCPFDCEFCDITVLYGRRPRVKSTAQIIAELEAIYATGWRGSLFFVDDNFIGNRRAIREILPEITAWMNARHHPFDFTTEVSIDLADDDELIELMSDAGFDTLFVGLETPNEDSLEECGKNQNRRRDLVGAVGKLQASGFQVHGGYIVGFDNDDEKIFSRQIRFIQESGVVTAMVGLLNAPRNTRLWKRLRGENRLLTDSTGDNTDGTVNFIPNMDRETLIAGYRRIVRTIYHPRVFYLRVCRFLERYRPRGRKRFTMGMIPAFFRTLLFLGVLGKRGTRRYYWGIFFRAVTRHRRAFAEAITLMVYGHHFRRFAERI